MNAPDNSRLLQGEQERAPTSAFLITIKISVPLEAEPQTLRQATALFAQSRAFRPTIPICCLAPGVLRSY